jgi:hypothetical protein
MRSQISAAILAASLAASVACVGRVRFYDEPHHDYHRWNSHEEVVYRGYLNEEHRPYRDFHSLSAQEQNEYWTWRHGHSDR